MIDENISPYRLGKMMKIRPQMIYNYIKNGYIPASRNELHKLVIKKDDANAFIEKYESNKVARETKRQELIQTQLKGK